MSRLLLAACALSLLAGCGLRGGLDRPPPLWGEDRAAYERDQEAATAAQEAREQEDELNAEEQPGIGSNSSSIPIPH